MNFAGFARLEHDADAGAIAGADEVVMQPGHREQGGNGARDGNQLRDRRGREC